MERIWLARTSAWPSTRGNNQISKYEFISYFVALYAVALDLPTFFFLLVISPVCSLSLLFCSSARDRRLCRMVNALTLVCVCVYAFRSAFIHLQAFGNISRSQ